MVEIFEDHGTTAACNNKAIAVGVISAAGTLGRVVVLAEQRTHGVEQARQRPVFFLTASGDDDVLLTHLNQFGSVTDAVGAGRASAEIE